MKLLLHACCGPCSLEPGRIFAARIGEGHAVSGSGGAFDLLYYNPNIHPENEYGRRLDTCAEFARSQNWGFIERGYDPDRWEQEAGKYENDRAKRCRACYRLRFAELASVAAASGYDAISTTLSVSPYQSIDVIREELEAAGGAHSLDVLFEDFRPFYQEATRRSRELGMYRQNFCGCRFSEAEAAAEREERRRARKAAKMAAV